MPPIFATAARVTASESETLEHNALLFVGIVILATATEFVLEVVIIFVGFRRLFSCHLAFPSGVRIQTKCTGRHIWYSRSAAVAYEVALVEQFDKCMFAMT